MSSPPPTAQRISKIRRRLYGLLGLLISLMVGIAVWEGGIPWGIDFSKYAQGPDRFASSVRCLVWWCLGIDALLLIGLAACLPWWIGGDHEATTGRHQEAASRRQLGGVLLSSAMAIGLLVAIDGPRLSESLWNDEIWSMRESIHGSWNRDLVETQPADSLRVIYWEPLGWEHAIWRYETTNHHFLLNLAAKGGLTLWQSATGAEEWEFDEAALRAIPFLCALAGLVVWALLFRRLGFGSAAMLVPWLLALHPWYQQHATGMRGYALVFLFLPLTLISVLAILESGRWRSWLCYALCQFLLIYSWPGGAMVMVGFNLCFLLVVWRSAPARHAYHRGDQIKRWAIANLATLMALLPLVAPGVFQIGPYLQEEVLRHPMGLPWLRNLASFFFSGAPWPDVDGYSLRSGKHVTGEWLWRHRPILFPLAAASFSAWMICGLIAIFRTNRRAAALLVSGLLLGPLLSYFKATVATEGEDVFLYQWYFIFALPFFCGLVAVGVEYSAGALARLLRSLSGGDGQRPPIAAVELSLAVASLALFTAVIYPRTQALRQSSLEPRRESVHVARGGRALDDPAHAQILTAHIFRSALIYDPFGWPVKYASNDGLPTGSPPGLTQLMRIADTRDLTLFVNVGLPDEARRKYPEAMDLVDESGFFDLHSQHFGLEPQFERAVYRYRGGLFKFDFSRPKP